VAAISYSRFQALLGRELAADQGPLLYVLGAQLGQRMLQSSRKLSLMAYNDVHSRVEATLYELTRGPTAEAHPQGMRFRISRTEISRVVGCSREVVGKVLKSLEQQGVIAVSGQNVLVYHAPGGQAGAEGALGESEPEDFFRKTPGPAADRRRLSSDAGLGASRPRPTTKRPVRGLGQGAPLPPKVGCVGLRCR